MLFVQVGGREGGNRSGGFAHLSGSFVVVLDEDFVGKHTTEGALFLVYVGDAESVDGGRYFLCNFVCLSGKPACDSRAPCSVAADSCSSLFSAKRGVLWR